MSLDACSFRGICVRPLSMLIVAKQDTESGMFGILLCEVGLLLMCLLTGDRSVTKLIWSPGFSEEGVAAPSVGFSDLGDSAPWVMRSSM